MTHICGTANALEEEVTRLRADLARAIAERDELALRLTNVLEYDVTRAIADRDAALAEIAALEKASQDDVNTIAAVCRERTAERDRALAERDEARAQRDQQIQLRKDEAAERDCLGASLADTPENNAWAADILAGGPVLLAALRARVGAK